MLGTLFPRPHEKSRRIAPRDLPQPPLLPVGKPPLPPRPGCGSKRSLDVDVVQCRYLALIGFTVHDEIHVAPAFTHDLSPRTWARCKRVRRVCLRPLSRRQERSLRVSFPRLTVSVSVSFSFIRLRLRFSILADLRRTSAVGGFRCCTTTAPRECSRRRPMRCYARLRLLARAWGWNRLPPSTASTWSWTRQGESVLTEGVPLPFLSFRPSVRSTAPGTLTQERAGRPASGRAYHGAPDFS